MSGHNVINCEAYKGDTGFFDYFTSIFFPIIIFFSVFMLVLCLFFRFVFFFRLFV